MCVRMADAQLNTLLSANVHGYKVCGAPFPLLSRISHQDLAQRLFHDLTVRTGGSHVTEASFHSLLREVTQVSARCGRRHSAELVTSPRFDHAGLHFPPAGDRGVS